MTDHYLAMSITQDQVDNLLATLKTIDASLPSLIELTPDHKTTKDRVIPAGIHVRPLQVDLA